MYLWSVTATDYLKHQYYSVFDDTSRILFIDVANKIMEVYALERTSFSSETKTKMQYSINTV